MLISEGVQSSKDMEKKYLEEKIVKEGMELLKKQKEEARRRKIKEQQEVCIYFMCFYLNFKHRL